MQEPCQQQGCPTAVGKVKPFYQPLPPAPLQQHRRYLCFHRSWNERKGWPFWSGKWDETEGDGLKTFRSSP